MAASAGLAVVGLGFALRRARQTLLPQRVPLLGLAAAFVFAAQMLNFPVAGGTSGHLLGGVLSAVLLGPSAAVVVMAAVVIVQCLMFADGGVLALGANLLNMAILGPVGGYAVYRLVRRLAPGTRGMILAAAFAAWCSVVLAAVSCAGQLALSRVAPWSLVFSAMTHIHMVIGVGEGMITGLILTAILRMRPELLEPATKPSPRSGYGELVVYGLLIAGSLALFVAPFASPWPDGLEKVAATLGFASRATAHSAGMAPFPEYRLPGGQSPVWVTAWIGAIGTGVAFGLAWLLARWLIPGGATSRGRPASGSPAKAPE